MEHFLLASGEAVPFADSHDCFAIKSCQIAQEQQHSVFKFWLSLHICRSKLQIATATMSELPDY